MNKMANLHFADIHLSFFIFTVTKSKRSRMDPVEELNPPEPQQMRKEEASTDDNEYVSQDMELKEWLEWLHEKYNIPEPQQKRMEGASDDDDEYVSQDMELEEWLEWLHEKYRTPEPQQMRMEEASTAVNRCVSEDMEFEEWVDWMAAQYEPPDPQQMNSSVTEEEDIDEWIDWMAEQYDSTVAEAHESPSDLNVLQSNTVTKPKRSRMDPVEELNPPEPQQMRMEEASTADNGYVSQDTELEKWFESFNEKNKTPEPQEMRMDEASIAVNICLSDSMEFEEWVYWKAVEYELPDSQQMNSSVTEDEAIEEWINWMAAEYPYSTAAEAHESPSDLNVLPEKQNGKLQTDIANNSKTMSLVSPGSLLSLDKGSPERCTSEKHKTISDSLCPKNYTKITQLISALDPLGTEVPNHYGQTSPSSETKDKLQLSNASTSLCMRDTFESVVHELYSERGTRESKECEKNSENGNGTSVTQKLTAQEQKLRDETEQFTPEKDKYQKLIEEIKMLSSNFCTKPGPENSVTIKTPQEKYKSDEGRVCLKLRTPFPVVMADSPERKMQDNPKVKEDTNYESVEPPTMQNQKASVEDQMAERIIFSQRLVKRISFPAARDRKRPRNSMEDSTEKETQDKRQQQQMDINRGERGIKRLKKMDD
ncbi:titin homolog isoform X1 [Paralichthys olivaceus]|uniref:titin homolog isoform X1 n=1 Tax=Paralichthys olivaceus TaxID=8255 RepID=UPI003753D773